jgi:hypothetical protein
LERERERERERWGDQRRGEGERGMEKDIEGREREGGSVSEDIPPMDRWFLPWIFP